MYYCQFCVINIVLPLKILHIVSSKLKLDTTSPVVAVAVAVVVVASANKKIESLVLHFLYKQK